MRLSVSNRIGVHWHLDKVLFICVVLLLHVEIYHSFHPFSPSKGSRYLICSDNRADSRSRREIPFVPIKQQSLNCLLSDCPTRLHMSSSSSSQVEESGEEESEGDAAEKKKKKSIFIFGLGYVGAAVANECLRSGWKVSGTCTNVQKIQLFRRRGVRAYLLDEESGRMAEMDALRDLLSANCILSTVPPSLLSASSLESGQTDPVLSAHGIDIKRAVLNGCIEWVGYLSSTGLYGDKNGAWTTELDRINPDNEKTKARAVAEQSWRLLKYDTGLPIHVFRLAGIYGPGRSAVDTVRKNRGDLALCGANDKYFVSRIHVSDIVTVLLASMEMPLPGSVLNVADDLPSTRYEVLSYACRLLKYPLQNPESDPPSKGRSSEKSGVRGGSKRVDNYKMRQLLELCGKDLKYPDYRSGLQSILLGSEPDPLLSLESDQYGNEAVFSSQDSSGYDELYLQSTVSSAVTSFSSSLLSGDIEDLSEDGKIDFEESLANEDYNVKDGTESRKGSVQDSLFGIRKKFRNDMSSNSEDMSSQSGSISDDRALRLEGKVADLIKRVQWLETNLIELRREKDIQKA